MVPHDLIEDRDRSRSIPTGTANRGQSRAEARIVGLFAQQFPAQNFRGLESTGLEGVSDQRATQLRIVGRLPLQHRPSRECFFPVLVLAVQFVEQFLRFENIGLKLDPALEKRLGVVAILGCEFSPRQRLDHFSVRPVAFPGEPQFRLGRGEVAAACTVQRSLARRGPTRRVPRCDTCDRRQDCHQPENRKASASLPRTVSWRLRIQGCFPQRWKEGEVNG